jgi:hypothetical protein
VVGFALLGSVRPLTESGFIVCAFRRTTGIPCPGCGLTRAMAALARGDLLAALRLHPFAPLFLLESAVLWAMGLRALLRDGLLDLPSRLVSGLVVWQGAALVALWLGRLATGTLPG